VTPVTTESLRIPHVRRDGEGRAMKLARIRLGAVTAGTLHRPHGRIAFANTDLAGASDHRNSIREADRAVKQLLGA